MANKYIKFITFFAVILLIALQIIWLRNSYLFAKNEISTNVSDLLENAIDQETFSRLSLLPKGTMVKSRPKSDSGKDTPEFAYMQESLVELGHPLSLDTVANMYREILRKKHIPNTFSLIMLKDNQLIAQAGDSISSSIFLVKSREIPIRPDYSITIQAQIINPQKLFYQRMGILLLSTSLLILFVISCIIYQIRIIARMNKIFQIREDFTYAMIHDMKTPLSSIFTALYFLHSGRLDNKPETKEKYYTIAENEAGTDSRKPDREVYRQGAKACPLHRRLEGSDGICRQRISGRGIEQPDGQRHQVFETRRSGHPYPFGTEREIHRRQGT